MADKILLVDDTLTDLTEKRSTLQNNKTRYVSPLELVNEGNGGYTYTEVAVSSGSILSMGSSPVELLAAPGANKYYGLNTIILEYTHVGTSYTLGTITRMRFTDGNGYQFFDVDPGMLTEGVNNISSVIPISVWDNAGGVGNTEITQGYSLLNDSLSLILINDSGVGVDPTLGDGTLLVKIWYKVKTFGTEL